jgi:hypothetical protein
MFSVTITLLLLQLHTLQTPLTLNQAVDQGLVSVSVTSNPNGTHYQEPVIVTIVNISGATQYILMENGSTFTPEDSAYQRMIVIQQQLLTLSIGETKEIRPSAMCFDHYKQGPVAGVKYRVGRRATGKLARMTAYLEEQKLTGYSAQNSIWSVSNGDDLENIVDWDQDATNELVNYVAGLTGQAPPPPPQADDYRRNLNVKPRHTVGGNFEFMLIAPTTDVRIAMFDKNNIVVRELYHNPDEKPGNHFFNYEFDASVYTDEVYFVRYLENNEVFMELKIDS